MTRAMLFGVLLLLVGCLYVISPGWVQNYMAKAAKRRFLQPMPEWYEKTGSLNNIRLLGALWIVLGVLLSLVASVTR